MAGESHVSEVTSYLSRLTGETVTADQPVTLRSVHRAALIAWARKKDIVLDITMLASGQPLHAGELLSGAALRETAAQLPVRVATQPDRSRPAGVGIDIEDIDALPQSEDYREHAFYRDNYTASEIAYCIKQPDVRASLCGLWAAKEAVLKTGLVGATRESLKDIEIMHDAAGRPIFGEAQISISHTAKTAVAICLPVTHAAILQPSLPAMRGPDMPNTSRPAVSRSGYAMAAAVVVTIASLSALIAFASHLPRGNPSAASGTRPT